MKKKKIPVHDTEESSALEMSYPWVNGFHQTPQFSQPGLNWISCNQLRAGKLKETTVSIQITPLLYPTALRYVEVQEEEILK